MIFKTATGVPPLRSPAATLDAVCRRYSLTHAPAIVWRGVAEGKARREASS